MTTFLDGPARGQTLMLKRSPIFLRVVEHGGKWDALDQLDDRPEPSEKLHAYTLAAEPGSMHIRAAKGRGGFYRIAEYKLVTEQPDDATMRREEAWQAWCRASKGKLNLIAPTPMKTR